MQPRPLQLFPVITMSGVWPDSLSLGAWFFSLVNGESDPTFYHQKLNGERVHVKSPRVSACAKQTPGPHLLLQAFLRPRHHLPHLGREKLQIRLWALLLQVKCYQTDVVLVVLPNGASMSGCLKFLLPSINIPALEPVRSFCSFLYCTWTSYHANPTNKALVCAQVSFTGR